MSQLLAVEGLGKRFGGFVALEDISVSVKAGERVGLIGPNGSGKSTLVNCICGTLQNEAGSVSFDGHSLNGSTRTSAPAAASPAPFSCLGRSPASACSTTCASPSSIRWRRAVAPGARRGASRTGAWTSCAR